MRKEDFYNALRRINPELERRGGSEHPQTHLVTPMRNDRYPLLRNRDVLYVCKVLGVGFLNGRQQHKRIAVGWKNGMR